MESHRAQPSRQNPPRTAALPVWLDPLIWLFILIVVACLGFYFDQTVVRAIAGHQITWLEHVAGIISKFGDWPELMGYAAVALIGVGFARKRTLVKVILCMMIAGTLAGALTNSVRLLSGRARPNNYEVPPGWYGLWYQGQWLLGKYKFHSFPSGHTATAFAFFGSNRLCLSTSLGLEFSGAGRRDRLVAPVYQRPLFLGRPGWPGGWALFRATDVGASRAGCAEGD